MKATIMLSSYGKLGGKPREREFSIKGVKRIWISSVGSRGRNPGVEIETATRKYNVKLRPPTDRSWRVRYVSVRPG